MVLEYLQLLEVMVFLVEVLDITLEVAAEVVQVIDLKRCPAGSWWKRWWSTWWSWSKYCSRSSWTVNSGGGGGAAGNKYPGPGNLSGSNGGIWYSNNKV